MLLPTIYESSTIGLPTLYSESLSDPEYAVENDVYVGGTKIDFVAERWCQ